MAEVKRLIEGYKSFYQKYFASGNELYHKLDTEGQAPKTLIIACSDSRVDPSIITSAEPGDILIVRNVANLVPPCETGDTGLHGVSAALEFAVTIVKVKHIVVLGHSKCAGIGALLNSEEVIKSTDFIGKWVDIAKPAKEKVISCAEEDKQHMCEKEGIILSLNNLLTFPWVREKVAENELKLHGWYFTLQDGSLQEYSPDSGEFKKIQTSS